MKKFLLALTAMSVMASAANAMYLVGNPAGEWAPNKGIEMEEVAAGWQWTGIIGSNDYFCFATQLTTEASDWATFNSTYRLAPESRDLQAVIGEYNLLQGVDQSFRGCGELCTYTITKVDDNYKLTVAAAQGDIPTDLLYVIGAPAGEWNPSVGIEMEKVVGGWKWTATVAPNDYFCFATQLEEEPSAWEHFNANYRLSPISDGTEAIPGEYSLYRGGDGASFKGIGIECSFFIRKDADNYYLSISSDQEVPIDVLIKSMGVIGGFNGWAEDVEMTAIAKNIWTATMADLDGEFKFRANANWEINFGGADSPTYICTDEALPIFTDGGNFSIENGQNVTFILDIPNRNLLTKFNSSKATPLALRGGMNEWDWKPEYCFFETVNEGVYSLTIPSIEAGTEFKIANQDWGWQYSSNNLYMVPGEEYELDMNGSNMAFGENYSDVTFVIDTNKNTLTSYTSTSGISNLTIDQEQPIYFNLQGAKVEKDAKGVLIRVYAGKAEKVIVK